MELLYLCGDKSVGAFFKIAFPTSRDRISLLPFYQQQEV